MDIFHVPIYGGTAVSGILVVEGDPKAADFVRRGLVRGSFDAIEVASTGLQGLELAELTRPDLVIVDLTLPDLDGKDVCRRLRDGGDPGIIILTGPSTTEERVTGLEAGADDYLSKPFAMDELVARVRAVLRRRFRILGPVLAVADLRIDIPRRQVMRGSRNIPLTVKEFELLKLLAMDADRPLRREYIVERVWGRDFEGETNPVKVYVSLLRRKLNAGGEPNLIFALRGFGYVLRVGPLP